MPDFCHLHCHTQYSLLDGASSISGLFEKAKADGQLGVALTDHGNMFGAYKFVAEGNKHGIKAIVGCEFYLVEDRHKKSFLKSKGEKDKRYHQLLLAKNQTGYQNLSKLCSLGFIEGSYGKFPRIDKEILVKYTEGVIATSCCIGAEIPQAILKGDLEDAEAKIKWWLDLFGDDFYIELQRHAGLEDIDGTGVSQEDINQQLLVFAKKFNIKVIATNDSHYIEEEDYKPHEILLCLNTGKKLEDENRFKFPSSDFYFKTKSEMSSLFKDVPEAIANTVEIYDKIVAPELKRDILLPNFPLPTGYKTQAEYLRYLVYEGAKIKYGEITEKVRERIDLELNIIKDMGFEGYFLIVQDFIKAAREIGVSVGPGRGSAAGSAVAYCLTITNIDPLKYNLLFERFLNPERISMPDIDIDFDDEGRQKVIDWVVDKYGQRQVAQIVTFGTMAAKSSIRDVGRVLSLPLSETDKIAKLVPTRPGIKLNRLFTDSDKDLKKDLQGDDYSKVQKLLSYKNKKDLEGDVVNLALKVEGSVRNTGIHAAGIIIAPDDITKYIPVCTSKDTELFVTQFDGSVVEDAGMLKMDFLGLKTLSIIKTAVENIVIGHGEEARIDTDEIPLDDEKTYDLVQKGEMIAIFQFESEAMRKHLKDLKPTNIEDLIAMNALYRPGPMDYIPSFIRRKHGKEPVEYPHPWLEDILKPTYGIMVYQEQIMQAAQIMADYSLGKADVLRRAMGKKKKKEMDKQRVSFVEGATAKGVDEAKANEIFDIMAKFAQYGFNRSHAAAYSVLAYHTAYLKAHYPAEFMASVLTHNKNDIGKLNFFLREAKRMGLTVLGPDVNESDLNFTVNEKGHLRFGLSALKGVGEGPVEEMVKERANGHFKELYDLAMRVNLRSVNKKCFDSLAMGGAFDSFGVSRASYFEPSGNFNTSIEHALKFGNSYQSQKEENQHSLFGDISEEIVSIPEVKQIEEWPQIEKLTKEKDVTGIYISGHPLDEFLVEMKNFTNCTLDKAADVTEHKLKLAGLVTSVYHGLNKKGLGYGRFTIQDYLGEMELFLTREDYRKYENLFKLGQVLYIEGIFNKGYNSDRFFFKVMDVKLLDTVGSVLTKSITLELPVEDISKELLSEMDKVFASKKGRHQLKVLVTEQGGEMKLPMVSGKVRVNADTEFAEKLEKLGIRYKLN